MTVTRRNAFLLATCLSVMANTSAPLLGSPVTELSDWLKTGAPIESLSEQPFAKQPLTSDDAKATYEMLWKAHADRLRKETEVDWKAGFIKSGDVSMKFTGKVYGKKPEKGWQLFISMHGGGTAPQAVNDQQWENQINLYKPNNSIYIAPHSMINEWNMWHEPNVDTMFDRLIAEAIVFRDVDPDHVYLMGYSAGGDGVYQLAPRMADRFAAASMMAGHPNDASPLGLRNLPFTIHVGGNDTGVGRNKIAAVWGKKLDDLQTSDPEGYVHETNIHEGLPHWMNLEDAVAVPWMQKFTRERFPKKVVWKQAGRTHDRFYWLAVPKGVAKGGALVVANRDGQTIEVEKAEDISDLTILLSDEMVDLDKPVVIKYAGKELSSKVAPRTILQQSATLEERGDPKGVFSASVTVHLGAPAAPPPPATTQPAPTTKPIAELKPVLDVPGAVAFLKANLPAMDRGKVTDEFLTSESTQALEARRTSKWASQIPDELFFEYVLPYSVVDEKREPWRATITPTARELIGDSATIEEAVKKLNAGLYKKLNVQYHATKRPRPNQSLSESIEATYASCSGLSIMLIDACRAVNIPARMVGIASWVAPSGPTYQMGGGNHAWVEIWDGRQWRFIGSSEPSELDQTWFVDPASRASDKSPLHKIYATALTPSPEHFIEVWAETDTSIPGIDMTAYYAARTKLRIAAPPEARVEIRDNGRLVGAGAPGVFLVGGGRKYVVKLFGADGQVVAERTTTPIKPTPKPAPGPATNPS